MKQFHPREDEQVVITMPDGTGREVELELLDTVVYQDREYAILIPLEEEDSAVILSVEGSLEDGATCQFGEVEENLLEAIFAVYEEQAAQAGKE